MSMLVFALEAAAEHYFPGHPECPERVLAIEGAIGWLAEASARVHRIREYAQVPEQLLLAVHSAAHLQAVRAQSAAVSGPTATRDPDDPDGPTYATPGTAEAALRAASAAIALLDAIMAAPAAESAAAPVGFSCCRPPGHHATSTDQMGFCLLNTVALVARHAQQHHGLRKVLILDWDVHHGNGTQDIFYSDPSVLFIDLHQDGVWPGSGRLPETGAGDGEGLTINVPLPWHAGHSSALRVMQEVVAPAARRFKPDLILISAGYDAHYLDPLEHLQFQSSTYHALTSAALSLARELCGGRLLLLLEGGYNQEALAEAISETLLALLDLPSATPSLPPAEMCEPEPAGQVNALLQQVCSLHLLR